VGPFESGKDAEEEEERGHSENCEDTPFKAAGLPENRRVAKGAKPEQIYPVGERRAAAEDDHSNCGKYEENSSAARAGRLYWAWPINRFWQFFTPLCVLL
jgi:hypothetical protein